jgi:hypothetical protein
LFALASERLSRNFTHITDAISRHREEMPVPGAKEGAEKGVVLAEYAKSMSQWLKPVLILWRLRRD